MTWFKNNQRTEKPQPTTTTPTAPVDTVVPTTSVNLSWNRSDKPERGMWTNVLLELVGDNLDTLMSASDVLMIHPALRSFDKDKQVKVLCEFFVRIAYYESAWDPKSSSVDVGHVGDLDTYSVGLMQMSVVDQANHGLKFGYKYKDLMDGSKNLILAMAIMVEQVRKRGKIFITKGEKGLYWATICPGGKYDKTAKITAEVQAMFPGPMGQGAGTVDQLRTELVGYALDDVGMTEDKGPNRSEMIDEVNRNVPGGSLGAAYCMSGLVYRAVRRLCKNHGWTMPSWINTASTQGFYNSAPAKYKRPKGDFGGKKGDICIQQSYSNPGLGHAYMLTAAETKTGQQTVEYNTNPAGSRNGDGVYKRTRTQAGDSSKKFRGSVDVVQAILDHNGVS